MGDRGDDESVGMSTEHLLRKGRGLELTTLGWNVVGIVVLALAALRARSVALAGFGLDSVIEVGASTVVLWELAGTGAVRQHRALRMIAFAFIALAVYLGLQSTWVLIAHFHPKHSAPGIAWTGVTAVVMFVLASGKAATGRSLDNAVLIAEGRVTTVDGILAASVLVGLSLNALFDWWWADPLASYVLVMYGGREAWQLLRQPGQH